MEATQKWSEFDGSIQKPDETVDEESRHKERRARELRVMVERAEKALDGNRQLLEKKRAEREKRNMGAVAPGGNRDVESGLWFR